MKRGHHHLSFWKSVLREAPAIIGLTALIFVADHFGWLRPFETAALDKVLRLDNPIKSRFTRLVAINQSDYDGPNLFAGRSPLEPAKLFMIIQAIAAGNPKLIAVDVDTSGEEWNEPKLRAGLQHGPPIVWAQEAIIGEGDHPTLEMRRVLGGTQPSLTGVAMVPTDWDNVVRRYSRTLPTEHGRVDSFPWKVVKTAAEILHATGGLEKRMADRIRADAEREELDHGEAMLLNFGEHRLDLAPISAAHVLKASKGEGWKTNGPLTGKIVILGQEHRATRDYYITPIGLLSGIRIVGQAVESELQGRGYAALGHLLMVLIDLAGGVLMVALHHFLRPRLAFWMSVTAVPVIGFGGSYVAFGTITYWASFVPVLVGVLLHLLFDHLKEYRRLCRELEERVGGPL